MFLFFIWLFFFVYLFYLQFMKLSNLGFFTSFNSFLIFSFDHQGFQSSVFFKFFIFLLTIFWFCGLLFPLFNPWASVGFLFFFTNLSWFGVRVLSLASESFIVSFELEHSWSWFTSLFMFFTHFLSYVMCGVALTLRISIIFLIGHFLMFTLMDFSFLSSFFFMLFVFPLELFFAFLQSYIFLVLICMFLLNMI